jgi:ribosomal protein L1
MSDTAEVLQTLFDGPADAQVIMTEGSLAVDVPVGESSDWAVVVFTREELVTRMREKGADRLTSENLAEFSALVEDLAAKLGA